MTRVGSRRVRSIGYRHGAGVGTGSPKYRATAKLPPARGFAGSYVDCAPPTTTIRPSGSIATAAGAAAMDTHRCRDTASGSETLIRRSIQPEARYGETGDVPWRIATLTGGDNFAIRLQRTAECPDVCQRTAIHTEPRVERAIREEPQDVAPDHGDNLAVGLQQQACNRRSPSIGHCSAQRPRPVQTQIRVLPLQ